MKKIMMMILLGSALAHAEPLICESVDQSDRCNDVVTRFELDVINNTFTYDSFYTMKMAKGCGWPPAGFTIDGSLQKINEQSYSLVSPDMGGAVKYDGKSLIYSASPDQKFECVQ